MNDKLGIHLRLREGQVVSALRRVIPGDYKTVTEAVDPTLESLGFIFADARVSTEMSKSIPTLFLSATVSERYEPVAGLLRNAGSWTFILDCSCGAGASALWLLSVMDFPDRFLASLPDTPGSSGPILLRKLKQGWMIGLQAATLKEYMKHGRRNY